MRRYQVFILAVSFLALFYVVIFTLVVTAKAAQGDDLTPSPTMIAPTEVMTTSEAQPSFDVLATQVFNQSSQASVAAADARRYAEDASVSAGKHFETANDLLGLFQNVTAIVGVLLPVLALVGGYLGFNQLNEAQKKLDDARERFEKEVAQKTVELQRVREELEKSVTQQRENASKANLALSLLPIGERQYRAGDYAGAIEVYKRALELDPGSVIACYRLGYVYTQSGNLVEAQEYLKRGLEIEKNFAPALACLGYVYRRIGEKMEAGVERNLMLDQASMLLLKALQLSPKLIDEDNESWWGSLGGLYRRRSQVDEAIFAYRKAAEATPNSSYAFSNLALLYAQKGDVDAMLQTYKRVEQLAANETQVQMDNYWGYADLLTSRLALGKVEKAEDALASVFRTAPVDSPYAFESLLDTLRRLQTLSDETRAEQMQSFIERIQAQLDGKNGVAS